MKSASPKDLDRVRAAFRDWRQERSGRGRIPGHLWDAACAMLDLYPLTVVARELGLNATKLRARHESASTALERRREAMPRFVELLAASPAAAHQLAPAAPPLSVRFDPHGVPMAIERPDGSRLSLCVPASDWERVESLCVAFLRA